MNLTSWILVAVAALCGVTAVVFVARGLSTRQRAGNELYAVGRQAQRYQMQVNLVRSAAFLVLALIALVVFGLTRRPMAEPAGASTPAAATATVPAATSLPTTAAASPVPSPALGAEPTASAAPVATPTTPPDIPSLTPTATATATETPRPPTAVVSSPNGLYLREAAGGTQELELIADGSELLLLDGREVVDELEWQRVRTSAGNEGWVALDFIIIQESP